MHLVFRTPQSLTADEYRRCTRLCFQQEDAMRDELRDLRAEGNTSCEVVMLFDGERLEGWTLTADGLFGIYLDVYVRAASRGRGYARMLVEVALSRYPNLWVRPHDETSVRFFAAFCGRVRLDDCWGLADDVRTLAATCRPSSPQDHPWALAESAKVPPPWPVNRKPLPGTVVGSWGSDGQYQRPMALQ